MILTPPAASFARGGHGGGHAGFGAMGGFARPAGSGAIGNVPISGIARGPANAGGLNNVAVDPSGVGHASRLDPLPWAPISAPTIPPIYSCEECSHMPYNNHAYRSNHLCLSR